MFWYIFVSFCILNRLAFRRRPLLPLWWTNRDNFPICIGWTWVRALTDPRTDRTSRMHCRTRCISASSSAARRISLWSLNSPLLSTIPMSDLLFDSSTNCRRWLISRQWYLHSVHNAVHLRRIAKIPEHLAVSIRCTCDVCWRRPISVRWA